MLFFSMILTMLAVHIQLQVPGEDRPPGVYEEKAENILKEARDVITSYESLFFSFQYVAENEVPSNNGIRDAYFYASKDKYHMAMDGTTAISDGTTVWVHLEDVNEVHISYAEDADDSMTPTALVERFDEAFRSKWIRREDHGNREIHIIDLVPREPQVFFKYRLALDSENLQIVYTEAHDRQGGVLRYDVVAFEANPSLDEGLFSFDPGQHPGIEVIDLR